MATTLDLTPLPADAAVRIEVTTTGSSTPTVVVDLDAAEIDAEALPAGTVLATNIVPNPDGTGGTAGADTATGTLSVGSSLGAHGQCIRHTRTGTGAARVGLQAGVALTASTLVTVLVALRSNVALTGVQLALRPTTSSSAGQTLVGGSFSLAAGVVQYVAAVVTTSATAPSATAGLVATWSSGAAGNQLDAVAAIVIGDKSTLLAEPFTGAYSPAPNTTPAWSGTPGASTSTIAITVPVWGGSWTTADLYGDLVAFYSVSAAGDATRSFTGLTVGKRYRFDLTVELTGASTQYSVGPYPVGIRPIVPIPSGSGRSVLSAEFVATSTTARFQLLTVANNLPMIERIRLTQLPDGFTFGLTRTDANGTADVRLEDGQELVGGSLIVTDYEPSLVGPISYTVTTVETVTESSCPSSTRSPSCGSGSRPAARARRRRTTSSTGPTRS
jgi:hypothetical protein